jgi:hypothetical protein
VTPTPTLTPTPTPTPTLTATPTPSPLACTPASQTVQVNQAAALQASGGPLGSGSNTSQYIWSASGGVPPSGAGSSFNVSYQSAGTKSVLVTDSLNRSATCIVIVSATITPTPTPTLFI